MEVPPDSLLQRLLTRIDHLEYNLLAQSDIEVKSLKDTVGKIQKARRAFEPEDAPRPMMAASHRGPGATTAELAEHAPLFTEDATRHARAQSPAAPLPSPEAIVREEWQQAAVQAFAEKGKANVIGRDQNPFAIQAPVGPEPPPGITVTTQTGSETSPSQSKGAFSNTLVKLRSPGSATSPAGPLPWRKPVKMRTAPPSPVASRFITAAWS